MFTASDIFYYCVIPKDKSSDPDRNIVISSDNICDIIFIQKMLKFEADIIIGHKSWNINADEVINVVETCRSQEYNQNGKKVFHDLMECFKVRLGLFWDRDMKIHLYRKYYQEYYDDYFNKLSKAKQANPPKAIFYNAFSKTVNEFINLEKKYGNIILAPHR